MVTTKKSDLRSNAGKKPMVFFRHFCFALLFLVLSFEAVAGGLDSLNDSWFKRPRLIAGFATKTTFISGFNSPIFTARLGVEYNRTVRVGAGVSWLKLSGYKTGKDNTPFYLDKSFVDTSGFHTVYPHLQFQYLNVFFEYVYYSSSKWEFSVPLQMGVGNSLYRYNYDGKNIVQDRHWILLYEPAVSGQYRITRWFGVGLDVGLRMMIVTNRNIGTRFNSPVYDVKVLIFWGELYKAVFPRER